MERKKKNSSKKEEKECLEILYRKAILKPNYESH